MNPLMEEIMALSDQQVYRLDDDEVNRLLPDPPSEWTFGRRKSIITALHGGHLIPASVADERVQAVKDKAVAAAQAAKERHGWCAEVDRVLVDADLLAPLGPMEAELVIRVPFRIEDPARIASSAEEWARIVQAQYGPDADRVRRYVVENLTLDRSRAVVRFRRDLGVVGSGLFVDTEVRMTVENVKKAATVTPPGVDPPLTAIQRTTVRQPEPF